ncbi:MAG: type 4a pilus biogenesis protein PilO [Minisyncoccia bacterium]
MAKKKLNLFQRRILSLVSLFIIVIIGLILFFFYFRRDIEKINKRVEEYKTELKNRQLIIERIQFLEKEIKEADPYLLKLKQSLPTETETVNLESQLKLLSEKYNLDFNFHFGSLNKETETEAKSYNFTLNLSGRFDNIIEWFKEVNKLFFSLRLEKIEINQTTSPTITKVKRGNQTVSRLIPASYEVKIVGRIYLR